MTRCVPAKDVKAVCAREVRKLTREEHGKTRTLYELAFPEDDQAFVDYYYEEVASRNGIYGVLEEGEVLSMLHLNPYELVIGEKECEIPYIVAVATRPELRHQGLMTSVFQKMFRELWREQVPFAFLMPAKEAIYRPFGFRYISGQNRMELKVKDYLKKEKLDSYPATYADVPDLSWFTSRFLKKHMGTYAKRTEEYYERLLLEQECQEGDIAVLTREGMICGWFFTGVNDGVPEVREAMVEEEVLPLLLPTVADCFRYDDKVRFFGFSKDLGGKEVPLMMGRIVNLSAYFSLIGEKVPEGFSFALKDQWIPENNGIYIWREGALCSIQDTPDIPILSAEELMEKFPLPGPVFLNELV